MPSTELLTAMGKFNEELVKAGVIEAGRGPASVHRSGARDQVFRAALGQLSAVDCSTLTNDFVRGSLWLMQHQIAAGSHRLDEAAIRN